MQDISGGQPVQLEGTDLPVWGMEIDPDKAKQQFRNYSATDKGNKVNICHVLPDSTIIQMMLASGSWLRQTRQGHTFRPRQNVTLVHMCNNRLNLRLHVKEPAASAQHPYSSFCIHFRLTSISCAGLGCSGCAWWPGTRCHCRPAGRSPTWGAAGHPTAWLRRGCCHCQGTHNALRVWPCFTLSSPV